MIQKVLALLAVSAAFALVSCEKKPSTSENTAAPGGQNTSGAAAFPAELVQKGRTVYQAQCIACHNANPKVSGALGPDVFGSSLELLQERILRAGYPEGYKPKRQTKAMVALPHVQGDIPALHAFLNSP